MMLPSEYWLEQDKESLANVLPRYTDIVANYGIGSWLFDVDGNKYLDFTSGIGATSTGHCHPEVVQAIKDQAEMLLHTSVTTHNTLNISLAMELGRTTPFEDPQVFFCNSGAEAVDGSLKLARKTTGKPGILAFYGGFHGRTVAATALTHTKRLYRDGYHHLPFVYHRGFGDDLGLSRDFLEYSKIGAIIVEPILGEGGYVLPKDGWLQHVRETADDLGALLIFDEVQTGIGRTGHWFAAETFGVTPDVILFAKGIASGLPLGGIIASRTLMDQWPEGTHGSTFGGNPVSCAAALATLDVIAPLLPRVRETGTRVREELAERLDYKVRGRGFMIGIELSDGEHAEEVMRRCRERGLLVINCGIHGEVLRLLPPLTVTDEELRLGISILLEVLDGC